VQPIFSRPGRPKGSKDTNHRKETSKETQKHGQLKEIRPDIAPTLKMKKAVEHLTPVKTKHNGMSMCGDLPTVITGSNQVTTADLESSLQPSFIEEQFSQSLPAIDKPRLQHEAVSTRQPKSLRVFEPDVLFAPLSDPFQKDFFVESGCLANMKRLRRDPENATCPMACLICSPPVFRRI
jgi:hypothetical protein